MPTRLASWSDRFLEASWLTAAVLVPTFFNVFSARVFEPDKLTAFRVLMLLAISAWLIREMEFSGGLADAPGRWIASLKANPFGVPLLVITGSYIISTIFSIQPYVSFFGSYQRLQGTLNNFLYFALFLIVATGIRNWPRIERLVSTIIAISVPVSAYGWLQHFGKDPLPWGGDVTSRVAGSMGNSIFLGAIIIMMLPFVAVRLFSTVDSIFRESGGKLNRKTAFFTVLYGLILLFDLVALFYTGSRGPWLGFAAGAVVWGFFWALAARNPILVGASVTLAVLLLGFLVLLNHPTSPIADIRDSNPFLSRLGTIADLNSGTNKVRVLIWFGDGVGKGAAGMITDNPFRTVVGWGPETMYVGYNRFYPPELAHLESRTATPDRSHNDLLDFLVTNGAIGLFAYLLVVVSFFALIYKLATKVRSGPKLYLVLGLAAVVTSHIIESILGIPVSATRTYLWMTMGLTVAVSFLIMREAAEEAPETIAVEAPAQAVPAQATARQKRLAKRNVKAPSRAALPQSWAPVQIAPFTIWAIVTVFFTANLLFKADFVQGIGVENFPSQIVLGAIGWLLVGVLTVAYALPPVPSGHLFSANRAVWLTGPLIAVIALFLSTQFGNSIVADIQFKRAQSLDGANRYDLSIPLYFKTIATAPTEDYYYLFLGRAILEQAKKAPDTPSPREPKTMTDLFALPAISTIGREQLYQACKVALDTAYNLNPLNTDHSANLGRLYRFWADATGDQNIRAARLKLSDQNYENALKLSPNAAHLWTEWGQTREAMGDLPGAQQRWDRAVYLDNQYAPAYLTVGNSYLSQANQKIAGNDRTAAAPLLDQASNNFSQAVKLDPTNAGAYSALGFIYHEQGRLNDAVTANEKVAQLQPNDINTRRNLAILYRDTGNKTKALEEAKFALNLAPNDQKPALASLVSELEASP